MPTGHVFIATSLDGFVARPDHRIDWLTQIDTGDEDHGYATFVASVDGIIMGSGSFRQVLSFDDWPYEKPVVVVSRSLSPADVPPSLRHKVRIIDQTPVETMQLLGAEGWSRAYVDGARLVQSFIRQNLIEDMVITTVPVLIGSGIRLFGNTEADMPLQMITSKSFASGLVQTTYGFTHPDQTGQ